MQTLEDLQKQLALWRDNGTPMQVDPQLLDWVLRENSRLRGWVADLHSGMYINCVYCGHRYGPNPETPVAMADVLKEHIQQCPEHPLSVATRRIKALEEAADRALWNLGDGADVGAAAQALGDVLDV